MATLRVRVGGVNLLVCVCEVDDHAWLASGMETPAKCARCQSRRWNASEDKNAGSSRNKAPGKLQEQPVRGPAASSTSKPATLDATSDLALRPGEATEGEATTPAARSELTYDPDI